MCDLDIRAVTSCMVKALSTDSAIHSVADIEVIKQQILYVRYGETAVCLLIVILVIIYFPAKPPKPPSVSASLEKVSFMRGIGDLFRYYMHLLLL